MKKIAFALIFILIILLSVIFSSNLWLSSALAAVINNVTGFPVSIDQAHLNIMKSQFGAHGIEVNNPKTFSPGRFVLIPEIYVDFELSEFIFARKLHFEEIRLDIEEVSIIRNPSGETNISQLKTLKKSKTEVAKEQETIMKAKSPKALNFFVDQLLLTIRRVRYQDQSNKLVPVQDIDLNISKEVFKGIASPSDIVRIIVLKITYKAALGNLGVPVDLLKGHLDTSLARGETLALQSAALAHEMGTGALDEGMRMVEQATDKIPLPDDAVQNIKSKTEGLFRGAERFVKNTSAGLTEEDKASS